MRYRFAALAASLLLGGVMIPSAALAQNELNHGPSSDTHPDGRGNRTRQAPTRGANASGGAAVNGFGISYHGGPVMLGTIHAYYIWYGNWAGNSATSILQDLATNIAPSPYFNINTTYSDAVPNLVTNDVIFGGSITDNYSRGTALSDGDIQAIVTTAIGPGKLPVDFNGVYFVLTSADVNETTGFCTSYCGWHTYGVIQNTNIKYSFVGNPDRCPSACEAQSVSPSGNAGADGMASIIAHELEESVTDPELNAWYDMSGKENADLCAWNFGSTYSVNGAKANMRLGGRDFLIQQNWVNASGGSCALSYASTAPDFSISATPAIQTVVPGSGTNYSVNLTRTPNFTGLVTFTVSGLPGGAGGIFTPSPTNGSSSSLAITTTAATPSGSYTLMITGTSGTLAHTTTVTLVVNASNSNFTISASPSSRTVARGSSTSYAVTVTAVNSFTGVVNFTVSGVPFRVSTNFSPSSVTGSGTSTLNVTVNRKASSGSSTLTITGTSGSLSHSTTPVTLLIN